MQKYPKLRRLGHESNAGILTTGHLLVQEKMDGANFRFSWDSEQDRIVFGSRNVEWTNEKDTNKQFQHAVDYVLENIDRDWFRELAGMFPGLTVYAEAMHAHTLDYEWDDTPNVLVYDVWDDTQGWDTQPYLIATDLHLRSAPVLYEGPAEAFTEEQVRAPRSEYRNGKAEGITIKNFETGQKAKYRSPEFKEMHGGMGANQDTPDDEEADDAVLLAHKFTTDARVKKEIAKMRDDGYTIEMGMMEDLWHRVFDDVVEEEYDTIFYGAYDLDTKDFRSEVASITARVLDRILSRPDDSVLNDGVIA